MPTDEEFAALVARVDTLERDDDARSFRLTRSLIDGLLAGFTQRNDLALAKLDARIQASSPGEVISIGAKSDPQAVAKAAVKKKEEEES